MAFPSARKISIENQFLLLCARLNGSEKEGEALTRLLSDRLNWDIIENGIFQHGIAGLVFYNLKKLEMKPLIPVAFWEKLEKSYQAAKLQVTVQSYELWRILDHFSKEEIPVIPLKGSFLREAVYPNPTLRGSADIDLLVQPKNLEAATQVLRNLGYLPVKKGGFTDPYRPEERHHLVPYYLPNRNFTVEMHWHIAPPRLPFHIDIEGIWERSTMGKLVDAPVHLLSPEDLLLHISLHAAAVDKKRFVYPLVRLQKVIDVAGVLHLYRDQIDWEETNQRAAVWGMQEPHYIMLLLTKELLGAAGYEQALDAVPSTNFNWSRYNAAFWGIMKLTETRAVGTETEAMLHFMLAEKKRTKAHLLWKMLFSDPEVLAGRYKLPEGSKRIFFYSVLNPFLLLHRYIRIRSKKLKKRNGT